MRNPPGSICGSEDLAPPRTRNQAPPPSTAPAHGPRPPPPERSGTVALERRVRLPRPRWPLRPHQGRQSHRGRRRDLLPRATAGAYLERVASTSSPQRVVGAVGESPLSERAARAQEL